MFEIAGFIPAAVIVTILAGLSQPFFVRVIQSMAAEAFDGQCFVLGTRPMTGLALDFRMTVLQGEIRVLAMIERRRIPAIGSMAVLALLTVSSRMTVVAAMAGDTGLFKLLLFKRAAMALFARQVLVLA